MENDGFNYAEHIEMLEKEIKKARIDLEKVSARSGVTPEEIANLERKIRLKTDLLNMVRKEVGEP